MDKCYRCVEKEVVGEITILKNYDSVWKDYFPLCKKCIRDIIASIKEDRRRNLEMQRFLKNCWCIKQQKRGDER